MTSREFCYWLQGYFEIVRAHEPGNRAPALTDRQTEMVRKHLALVFKHEIDQSYGDEKHQAELNAIHNDGLDDESKAQLEALKADVEELKKRPPQKVIGGSSVDPFGGALRC